MANINLGTGIEIPAQFPLDAKEYVKTLASLMDLGAANYKAFRYYEGLIVFCLEDKKQYIWRETIINEPVGLILNGFTYPNGSEADGIVYSLRNFNFFEYKPVLEIPEQDLPNEILSGRVNWLQDLDFRSTLIIYRINQTLYYAPITDKTLSPAHGTLNRIDVFAVNTNSEIIVIEGDPAANPQEKNVDFETELRLGIVYIPANATEPENYINYVIYNENLGQPAEFDTGSYPPGIPGGMINFGSNVDPATDTVSIEFTNFDEAYGIEFTSVPYTINSSVTAFLFELKNKAVEDYKIRMKLWYLGAQVGVATIAGTFYNFDATDIINHRTITIPINDFNLTSNIIDRITFDFTVEDNILVLTGLFMDNLRFLGDNNGNGNNTLNNTYLRLLDTEDNTYANKKSFIPSVNNDENKLVLINPILIPIDGCLVKKAGGNTDITNIEIGDEVYLRSVNDGSGGFLTLFGQTYDGGGLNDRANYTQNQSIDI